MNNQNAPQANVAPKQVSHGRHWNLNPITFLYITDKIAEIEALKGDDEAAHSKEDALYEDFIRSIAAGDTYRLQEKALKILETKNILFERWCG